MYDDVYSAAHSAGLTPLVARIAIFLADIDGKARAFRFIDECRLEDEFRASLCIRNELIGRRQRLLGSGIQHVDRPL